MTRKPIRVYVLEVGVYNDRYIYGAYATPEAAMDAHKTRKKQVWVGERTHDGTHAWHNGLDWEDAAHVSEFRIES